MMPMAQRPHTYTCRKITTATPRRCAFAQQVNLNTRCMRVQAKKSTIRTWVPHTRALMLLCQPKIIRIIGRHSAATAAIATIFVYNACKSNVSQCLASSERRCRRRCDSRWSFVLVVVVVLFMQAPRLFHASPTLSSSVWPYFCCCRDVVWRPRRGSWAPCRQSLLVVACRVVRGGCSSHSFNCACLCAVCVRENDYRNEIGALSNAATLTHCAAQHCIDPAAAAAVAGIASHATYSGTCGRRAR